MSTSDPSDELKLIYRRILRRVHPDLAVDEQDRITCERLTREANAAYQAGDLAALKAVLQPKPVDPPLAPPNIWEPWTYTEARQPLRQQPPPPQPPQPPPQQPRQQTAPPPRSEQPWRQPPPPRAGAAIPSAPAFTQISNDSPKGLVVAVASRSACRNRRPLRQPGKPTRPFTLLLEYAPGIGQAHQRWRRASATKPHCPARDCPVPGRSTDCPVLRKPILGRLYQNWRRQE